ncbi:MAG TPA: methyltransferase domain-containing protein [Polyangiales bacterium]|nr:methyltransferase domain-containing protein [Polyangiales bacterium]
MPKSALTAALQRVEVSPVGAAVLRPTNRRKLDAYLSTHEVRKLHLGCGGRLLPDWLNSDFVVSLRKLFNQRLPLVQIDCTRRLDIPNDSFDYIYSEHMHEHLDYAAGSGLLREVWRVLKPGGKVRIAVPDLDFYFRMFRTERSFEEYPTAFRDQIWQTNGLNGAPLDKATFLNFLFKGSDHKYIYTRSALESQVAAAGFIDTRVCEPGKSDTPELRDLETNLAGRDGTSIDMHLSYTVAVEGTKPSSPTTLRD